MVAQEWVVYGLLNYNNEWFWVGASSNHKRRLKEHYKLYGPNITLEILEKGSGQGRAEAERRWIAEARAMGFNLLNKGPGGEGPSFATLETRLKQSEQRKGIPKAPEHAKKIGDALRGKPHDWTPKGWANAAETMFKPGHNVFDTLSNEQKKARSDSQREWLLSQTPEQRSEQNRNTWANYTPEQRAERIRKQREGRWLKKSEEERKMPNRKRKDKPSL